MNNADVILHYLNQDDQPYGSVRMCCNICGAAILGRDPPKWTDDSKVYNKPPSGYVNCLDHKKRIKDITEFYGI